MARLTKLGQSAGGFIVNLAEKSEQDDVYTRQRSQRSFVEDLGEKPSLQGVPPVCE
jgi:hypothetical protein